MPPDSEDQNNDLQSAAASDATQRLDKWLWYARVAKTRSLAAALVEKGRVRVNKAKTQKPSHTVRIGDVITASIGRQVRVLKVLQAGSRRGPAPEAQLLFEDLSVPVPRPASKVGGLRREADAVAESEAGGEARAMPERVLDTQSGRPSKKQRRQIVRLKGQDIG